MKLIFTSLFALLFLVTLQAQDPSTIFHKTVDLREVQQFSVEVHPNDSLRIEPWVGNSLLIETNVLLNNGKPNIMKHFLEKGRWSLVENRNGESLNLTPQEMTRNILTTTRGEVVEEIVIVLYVPENFEPSGGGSWTRKAE